MFVATATAIIIFVNKALLVFNQSSSFIQHTCGLGTSNILVDSSSNNNNQTTNMAPSSDESISSFISPQMIGSAAKIFQYYWKLFFRR